MITIVTRRSPDDADGEDEGREDDGDRRVRDVRAPPVVYNSLKLYW
jgi:hypothetical protein